MDECQREKRIIQRREQIGRSGCSYLVLAAFLIPAIIVPSLTSGVRLYAFFFPILGILSLIAFGPFMQRTQQRKQNWLAEYGLHVLAPIARYPEENAFIIGGLPRGRNTSYYRYLNWQNPDTGQVYAFPVNIRFSSDLRNMTEGSLQAVQFDPDEPSFFLVSMER